MEQPFVLCKYYYYYLYHNDWYFNLRQIPCRLSLIASALGSLLFAAVKEKLAGTTRHICARSLLSLIHHTFVVDNECNFAMDPFISTWGLSRI